MRCPTCGNEVNLGESFCGQCGTPTTLPALPHRVVVAQSDYLPSIPPMNAGASMAQPQTPDLYAQELVRDVFSHPLASAGPGHKSGTSQHSEFYHDSTEALPFSSPEHYNAYTSSAYRKAIITPGQPLSAGPPVSSHVDLAAQQRYATGPHGVPPAQYGHPASAGRYNQRAPYRPALPAKIRKQPHQATVLTICICLIIALMSIIGLLSYLLLKTPARPTISAPTPAAARPLQTINTGGGATTIASISQPQMQGVPTSVADTNFVWCGSICASNNFVVEYPTNWVTGTAGPRGGVSFINPAQTDETVLFKVVEPMSSNTTADQMLTNDLQTNYANKPAYTAPATALAPDHVTTFGDHSWSTTIAYYQGDTQRERIEVYTTIYQQKAYVIDLQAPDVQFDRANTTYYLAMLNRYHFLD